MNRPAATPAAIRAGQTALLWRLGLLLALGGAALLPPPWRDVLLGGLGAGAVAALLFTLLPLPINAPAPPAPGGAQAAWLLPALGVGLGGVCLLLAWADPSRPYLGTLVSVVIAALLALLLVGRDPVVSARQWGVLVGVVAWALVGSFGLVALASFPLGPVPPLVVVALALGGYSAGRRAVALQGLGGRWPDTLGLTVGLTAIAVTATPVTLVPLALGLMIGLLFAWETERLVTDLPTATPIPVALREFLSLYHQLVCITPCVLLALLLNLLIHP